MVLLSLFALPGCAEWPRYAHPPQDTAARLEAGEAEAYAWDVRTAVPEPQDNGPELVAVEAIAVGEGAVAEGTLEGTGWDYGDTPFRDTACEHTSAFPPGDEGSYLYDVDWRVIELQEPTRLCSAFVLVEAGAQVDVVPFLLDDCGLPYEALRHAAGAQKGQVVGFGVLDDENRWAVDVPGGARLGLAAAAWAPTDPANVPTYRWGVAALPQDEASPDAAACPDLPAESP